MDKLVITPGEPAGIGPDLCIAYAQQPHDFQMVLLADPDMITERAELLGQSINLVEFNEHLQDASGSGTLYYLPVSLAEKSAAGTLNVNNASYILNTLDIAVQGCLNNTFDALVTGPIHKGIINVAGFPFTGHTEYLAEKTSTSKVVMMLATDEMRVALATTHLPLKEVSEAITTESLREVITILDHDLKTKYGLDFPHILICGLNPHAGEDGHLGMEELDIIIPLLEQLNTEGFNLTGPLPADTLFSKRNLAQADAVLAMYHDQGLPVLKYQGFGKAVNVTLGLPIIRTSVDHGTALDLAGTGQASTGSLDYALQVARQMVTAKKQRQY
ncbi:MAG: 4-hydroxythreonine-4-phosphate dehydrogenase PdxA [gamma proteobacterium symbiont of Bathyaustriella thionipta]|nr:4-hydroxythreonine-4-phosphate dehydrogenase PdxA [gamma proteobacterium symbiont of Bathyaustriella thionipta]MCU7948619.1 4-hydroxythreonine-4-phosphate dehydrogenase PdxA [gamma proteobacterium symbiont of Bathyaustriella thionipta]MCU7952876.1 4-hydroxythreonine-4-phosphate dehydrogenase PdxA [gamma proteobacterium symbiont of Bathyaustriella thionipta]MCU7955130.1 4-hydroxythreonine-4-phosphate dehydrogenase PdxA [gamma proteobacterium symbiont of Bathyaustriella thionipta]MCU7966090.1 